MLDKTSWQALLLKAKNGDAIAQYEVGDYFSSGLVSNQNKILVKQNLDNAFLWYEKAAKNNVVEAITNLADFLIDGKGCEKDIDKGIATYRLAIKKGSSRAALNLATVFRDKGNFKKAFEYYSLSAKMDKADYSFTIALCYYYGVGVAMNKTIACKHFLKVSVDKLQTHTQYEIDEANYILGRCYLTGEGVKKSIGKSRKFLALANLDKDHRSAEQILFIIGQTSI